MKIDWDAREDKNKNKSKQYDIELRPHHILTYPNYANPDTNYSAEFRKVKGNFHSDKLVKHWIKIIRSLHENPSLKFKYVRGIDSICKKCEHRKDCSNPKHINYKIVKDADQDAIKQMPELKFGEIYDGKFLKKLFKKITLKSRFFYIFSMVFPIAIIPLKKEIALTFFIIGLIIILISFIVEDLFLFLIGITLSITGFYIITYNILAYRLKTPKKKK